MHRPDTLVKALKALPEKALLGVLDRVFAESSPEFLKAAITHAAQALKGQGALTMFGLRARDEVSDSPAKPVDVHLYGKVAAMGSAVLTCEVEGETYVMLNTRPTPPEAYAAIAGFVYIEHEYIVPGMYMQPPAPMQGNLDGDIFHRSLRETAVKAAEAKSGIAVPENALIVSVQTHSEYGHPQPNIPGVRESFLIHLGTLDALPVLEPTKEGAVKTAEWVNVRSIERQEGGYYKTETRVCEISSMEVTTLALRHLRDLQIAAAAQTPGYTAEALEAQLSRVAAASGGLEAVIGPKPEDALGNRAAEYQAALVQRAEGIAQVMQLVGDLAPAAARLLAGGSSEQRIAL
ncbi:MAG: hypothetical protein J0L97_07100 [Alphaproteobacteria bacterium]|nr:hypothetical protein [Alphaproteobacteria bacterium]